MNGRPPTSAEHLTSRLVARLVGTSPADTGPTIVEFLEELDGVRSASVWLTDLGFGQLVQLGGSGTKPIDGILSDTLMAEEPTEETDGISVPMRAGGLTVGLIEIEGTIDRELAGELEQLAAVTADRVASLKGFSDVIERERRAGELGLAATIQHELMPTPGYRDADIEIGGRIEPAYDIAGDGYDYAVNEDELQFAIFDAVGHGLRSTLLTTVAIGAYRLHRRRRVDLVEIAVEVEAAVRSIARDGEFVTGVLCRSDLDGSLEVWNAGHLPPVIVGRAGVAHAVDVPPTLPFGLGLTDRATGRTQWSPDSTMYLFSDGVIEAKNAARASFGDQYLVELLSTHADAGDSVLATCRAVLGAVVDHVGGDLQDDATIMGARLLG